MIKETDTLDTKVLPVLEMNCAVCANNVENTVKELSGVQAANVNYATHILTVTFSPEEISLNEIQSAVRATGYDLIIEDDESSLLRHKLSDKAYFQLRRNTITAWLLTLSLFLFIPGFSKIPYGNWIIMFVTLFIILFVGKSFYVNGIKQAVHLTPNKETLIALSTFIVFIFSLFNTIYPEYWYNQDIEVYMYYEISGVIIASALLIKLLEEKIKRRILLTAQKLIELQPKTARKLMDENKEEVLVFTLQQGDILSIKPGEKIPADGIVCCGSSFVNEKKLTGETLPVMKEKGNRVFAGTINQEGTFSMKVTGTGCQTTLSHMMRMIQIAQVSKSPLQRLLERINPVFITVIIMIAFITFLSWWLIGGNIYFSYAVLSAVSVLVIGCSLNLVVPIVMMIGIGKAAKKRIFIKDAYALENLSKVEAVVMDKTGILTEGIPKVIDSLWLADSNVCYLDILYTAELESEHHTAKAITNWLKDSGATSFRSGTIEHLQGMGLQMKVGDITYWVGNNSLASKFNIGIPSNVKKRVVDMETRNMTVVYYGDDTRLLAILGVSDPVKTSSYLAIQELKNEAVEVHILTSDSLNTTRSVAMELGVPFYEANVLLEEKDDYIRALEDDGKKVAMVGNSSEEAQALNRANISVSLGKNNEIIKDGAMVSILPPNLNLLPEAIRISRKTIHLVRQNLLFVILYNLIAIPLAMGMLFPLNGLFLNPFIAVAGMFLSSLFLILNSLRLRFMK